MAAKDRPGVARRRALGALVGVALALAAAGLSVATARANDRAAPAAILAVAPPVGEEAGLRESLATLARQGMAIALLSTGQGGGDGRQALLDVSQGARVSLDLYRPRRPPPVRLVALPDGTGVLVGWQAIRRRAHRVPGRLAPGALAGALPGGAALVAADGRDATPALLAADPRGRVAALSLGPPATLVSRVRAQAARRRLVVVGLPAGGPGLAVLDALRVDRPSRSPLLVLPQAGPARLVALGAAGLGAGTLTSSTTRRPGLVSTVDLAPTILARLGLAVPAAMDGLPMRSAADGPRPARLAALARRWRDLGPRRFAALEALALAALALGAAMGATRGRRGLCAVARIAGLAALWAPSLMLATAALEPAQAAVEVALIVGGAFALGALTDAALPWPRAPLAPAAVALALHTADLAAGSGLITRSLLGPNPRSGARFYGIGNELEVLLCVLALAGVAGALGVRGRERRGVVAFAAVGLVWGAVLGSGRLGADVGGVVTLGSGVAVAALAMLPGGVGRRAALLAVLVPLAGVVALALVDLATGAGGHFTRTVLRAHDLGDLWTTLRRRAELALGALGNGLLALLTPLALVGLVALVARRDSLLAPPPAGAVWRGAQLGGLAAALAGTLANDSGPVLLVYGVGLVGCLAAYLVAGARRV